jgi:hypothetical protein
MMEKGKRLGEKLNQPGVELYLLVGRLKMRINIDVFRVTKIGIILNLQHGGLADSLQERVGPALIYPPLRLWT